MQHFKREWVSSETSEYLYKVLAFAQHTETGEKLVVYQGMYPPFKICARPYDMFMSEVDQEKYPKIRQKFAESLKAVLPVVGIVIVLSFTIAPITSSILLCFLVGAVMVMAGMMFFTLGAEMSMTPMGEKWVPE